MQTQTFCTSDLYPKYVSESFDEGSGNLTLRLLQIDDWRNYIEHLVNANEVFLQYGLAVTDELLKEIDTPTDGVIYYTVEVKGRMVGYIGIEPNSNNMELYIFKEYRRLGFGMKALTAFVNEYLYGTITGKREKEIIAETQYDNIPMRKLLEKAGFHKRALGIRVQLDENDDCSTLGLQLYEYRL